MKNIILGITLRFALLFLLLFTFVYLAHGQKLKEYKFPNDYRGIIHLHSELSHDSDGKFENIVKAAKNNDIDFVVMTDHWSPTLYKKSKRGFFENTLFIIGAEISKNENVTLIALPLPKNFVPENDWKKNVMSLHEKDSLALASHIEFSQTSQLVETDGVEITNLHAILVDRNYFGFFWLWTKAIWPKNWDLAFLFNSKTIENTIYWHYLNKSIKMPAFVGNDTHDNYRLFYKLGPKLGSYDNTFKLITTHIWAEELTEKSVVEAIKTGQSYFAFESFGDAKGFRFYATNNENVILPGNIFIPPTPKPPFFIKNKTTITIKAPLNKISNNTKIKIIKDGVVIKEGFGALLNLEDPKPGNYYAEIWKNEKPWIFSNPIKIYQ
ncbi:MAG TPA: hypothetical protein VJH05_01930 [Candidatus Paceibacterota bacterium]